MNDIILPQQQDYRSEIEPIIQEMHQVIGIILTSIEGQEVSPITIRRAIQKIEAHLSAIETDVYCLSGALDRLHVIAMKLMEQRDEALEQRDLLIALCGLPEYGEPLT